MKKGPNCGKNVSKSESQGQKIAQKWHKIAEKFPNVVKIGLKKIIFSKKLNSVELAKSANSSCTFHKKSPKNRIGERPRVLRCVCDLE